MEIKAGQILYLADREGYRSSRKENSSFEPMLPDYVVVESVEENTDYLNIQLCGFPNKKIAIIEDVSMFEMAAPQELSYFGILETIYADREDTWDLEGVKQEPYKFSHWYKAGFSDLETDDINITDLIFNMKNYHLNKPENKRVINDIFKRFVDSKDKTMLPSEMAYIVNRIIKSLYECMIVLNKGNIHAAHYDLKKILYHSSKKMSDIT